MSYIIIIAILLVVLFISLKPKKKVKIIPLENVEVPEHWHPILLENILFYKKLTKTEQKLFCAKMVRFLETTTIEAIHFELEELDSLLIAASAIIPVFRFPNWNYNNLSTVLIYPDYFDEDLQFSSNTKGRNIAGLVGTGRFENHMILSRKALHLGFNNKSDKGNTAIHEFIHLIDKADGVIDGIPNALLDKQYTIPYLQLVHKKMEEINNDTSDIRNYGGTSEIEFLAVVGEYFFERPKLLKRKHPALYEMLDACFIKS
ncbi:zinc-dependent peptidase [Polaribacter vadi]|uniref:M90 family metallopeptidase n=1 Tax=Polaribacter TaxID=52959 RepID=UPI001C07F7DE|nr:MULTISPECIES: zinc-dependent peptidase [Polaribacter]MBU3012385.1 zinc-dependent peptidase [Polaribacter vadi]MDO6742202.1 zinc-dependent peptidase [Polaribacter sp. 1_MG-2023]